MISEAKRLKGIAQANRQVAKACDTTRRDARRITTNEQGMARYRASFKPKTRDGVHAAFDKRLTDVSKSGFVADANKQDRTGDVTGFVTHRPKVAPKKTARPDAIRVAGSSPVATIQQTHRQYPMAPYAHQVRTFVK